MSEQINIPTLRTKIKNGRIVESTTGVKIATVERTMPPILAWRYAEHIVRCVNQHDKLVAACEQAILQIEYLGEKFTKTGTGEAVLAQLRAALDD